MIFWNNEIWTTRIQEYLLIRARVESLTKHWDKANKDGTCPLCRNVQSTEGTIEHVLLSGGCPALVDARLSMTSLIQAYLVSRPYLFPIFQSLWGKDDMQTMQFLLDCSAIPLVRQQAQESENPILRDLFYLTRSYVFKLYVTRRRLIGLFWKCCAVKRIFVTPPTPDYI